MNEALIADGWLRATLGNDATLGAAAPGGVHADVAPAGVADDASKSPWVVWFLVSATDAMSMGSIRTVAELVYEVRATGRDCGYADLKAAANQLDVLLHRASGSTSDGTVVDCRREELVRFSEQDGERVYRHLGGQYRIWAQGAA